MAEQLNEQDKAMIDQLAGQQLGDANATAPAPQAPPQGMPPQQGQPPQAPQAPGKPPEPADAPTTEVEKAQQAVSPQTEADKSLDESVTMINVDFGDGDRNNF